MDSYLGFLHVQYWGVGSFDADDAVARAPGIVSVEAGGASGVHVRPEGYLHIVILLLLVLSKLRRVHTNSREFFCLL
jgi:hypothetical protein